MVALPETAFSRTIVGKIRRQPVADNLASYATMLNFVTTRKRQHVDAAIDRDVVSIDPAHAHHSERLYVAAMAWITIVHAKPMKPARLLITRVAVRPPANRCPKSVGIV